MKVEIVKQKSPKPKFRKPKREQYVFLSRVLWDIPLGYIYSVSKAQYRNSTHIEFKKYLKHQYKGHFIVIEETKSRYVIKRVKCYEEREEEVHQEARRRQFYLP